MRLEKKSNYTLNIANGTAFVFHICKYTKLFKEGKSQNRARAFNTTDFLIQAFLLGKSAIAG